MSFPYVMAEPAASVVPVVASVAEKKEVVAAVGAREVAMSAREVTVAEKRNLAVEVRRVISESDYIYTAPMDCLNAKAGFK